MVLARLDATDYRLSLESAEAELKAAQSSLKQAEADEGRYAALNKKSWVSDASYDQKRAAADEARGRVERSVRALSLAKNQLAYTDLVATEAGIITALPVEVGQVVSAGQLIVRVARLDELEAVVSIPESRIDGDRNAAATVTLWADAGRVYEASCARCHPRPIPRRAPIRLAIRCRNRMAPSRSARPPRCMHPSGVPAGAPGFRSPPCSRIRASRRYGSSMKRTAA